MMTRPTNDGLVFLGIKGTVVALERSTGREVWRTPLKGSDFVNLVLDDGALYATARGEIFCLDPATGAVCWRNPLRGMGRGLVTIATPGGSSMVPMAQVHAEDAARRHAANQAAAM
jgi:outer membrane protein assembly factor BamB